MIETTKTLDELEGIIWGPPTFGSHLVTTCHGLRTKLIQDFTIEDLRIMIGQKIGLDYLTPLALARLEENPWAEGNYYEGDLLHNVLELGAPFWQGHPEWKDQLDKILLKLSEMPVPHLADDVLTDIVHYQRRMAL